MIEGEDLELFERSLRAATETSSGTMLDVALAELGWRDALGVDPRAAISVLFRLQGEAAATSSALNQVVATALGVDDDPMLTVVLPGIDRTAPPGTASGDRLTVHGLGTAGFGAFDHAVVATAGADATATVVVPTSELEIRSIEGVDPWLELSEVSAEALPADAPTPTEGDWGEAVRLAQLAVSHELLGASRTMLTLAREHALERVQFDRPIAQFQAVRHRLAETLVAIEMAEALVDAAWIDERAATASMAKALAGRSARTASKHCQQVCAGIGFTTEHDLHRFIRRVLVLDELFGGSRTLTRQQGEQLLATGRLPAQSPL